MGPDALQPYLAGEKLPAAQMRPPPVEPPTGGGCIWRPAALKCGLLGPIVQLGHRACPTRTLPQQRSNSPAPSTLKGVSLRLPAPAPSPPSTEDRICGTIDIEKALTEGVKAYEPGLLARANRGIL